LFKGDPGSLGWWRHGFLPKIDRRPTLMGSTSAQVRHTMAKAKKDAKGKKGK